MPEPLFQRAAVVGVGLIGGSVALGLRERGLAASVVGVTRSETSSKRALASGVIQQATHNFAEGCRDADLVVVCTPVDSIAKNLLEAAKHAKAGALLTDAGSTKADLVAAVEKELGPGANFVGSHPLAGDHLSGPEAARVDLFDQASTVLTPTDQTPPQAVKRVSAFWEALGSNVVAMSPERHDTLLALSSHMPHVAAAAVAAKTTDEALALAAGGWADTTRVASGSATLWREILLANRRAVSDALRGLSEEINAYAEALDAGDGDTLERLLAAGKRQRDALGRNDALGS